MLFAGSVGLGHDLNSRMTPRSPSRRTVLISAVADAPSNAHLPGSISNRMVALRSEEVSAIISPHSQFVLSSASQHRRGDRVCWRHYLETLLPKRRPFVCACLESWPFRLPFRCW